MCHFDPLTHPSFYHQSKWKRTPAILLLDTHECKSHISVGLNISSLYFALLHDLCLSTIADSERNNLDNNNKWSTTRSTAQQSTSTKASQQQQQQVKGNQPMAFTQQNNRIVKICPRNGTSRKGGNNNHHHYFHSPKGRMNNSSYWTIFNKLNTSASIDLLVEKWTRRCPKVERTLKIIQEFVEETFD